GVGGRAVAVADSLRRAFTTAGGRTVYDGKGIEPDVEVGFGAMSELEEALLRQAAFLLFANRYAATHADQNAELTVTDADLQAFRAWLGEEDFSYRTDAEHTLDALAADLAEAGYGEACDELAALRREVLAEKEA